jgi:hypothetical protein
MDVPSFPRKVVGASLLSIAFLSMALRYPGDHEIGVDSFFIHTIAQSISSQGFAAWAPNLLAYFGWYPVSYPSGAPFLLSSVSQIAGVNMEPATLVTSTLLGLVGLLTAFLMAREFRSHALFALSVALIYGLAPRFLLSTLWQASTRNLFMAILPLFVWSLLRFQRIRSLTNLSMCGSIFVVLAAAHRLVAIVPLIILAFLVAVVIVRGYRVLRRSNPRFIMSGTRKGLIRWAGLVITVGAGAGFLFGTHVLAEYSVGELATGSSVQIELLNLAVSLARSIGLAAPLALVGLVYAPWLKNGGFREIFCMTALVAMVPTLFLRLYTGFYVLPFLAIIGSYGLHAIVQRLAEWKRAGQVVVVVAALSIVLFSGLVLHYEQRLNPPMSSATYGSGLFLAEANPGATVVCNDQTRCSQIAASGGMRTVPTAGGSPDDPSPEMLVFGFYNLSEVNQHIIRVPLEDLTVNSNSVLTTIGLDPHADYVSLVGSSLDRIPTSLATRYRPMYYYEIKSGYGSFFGDNGVAYPSTLADSVHREAYSVYTDGSEIIWWIQP